MLPRRNAGFAILVMLLLIPPGAAQSSQSNHGTAARDAWIAPMESGHFFAVRVVDVDAAIAWYERAFGLRVLDDKTAPDDRWRMANLINESLHVELIRDSRTMVREGRMTGFAKVGFVVPDVEEVASRIESATGSRPRIVDSEEHNIRILQLKDPEGNTIQLHSTLVDGDAD